MRELTLWFLEVFIQLCELLWYIFYHYKAINLNLLNWVCSFITCTRKVLTNSVPGTVDKTIFNHPRKAPSLDIVKRFSS